MSSTRAGHIHNSCSFQGSSHVSGPQNSLICALSAVLAGSLCRDAALAAPAQEPQRCDAPCGVSHLWLLLQ